MPYAPARPCAAQPCPALVTNGSRCRVHEAQRRPNANARGYTHAWQRLVRQAIALEPWCHCTAACHPIMCGSAQDLTGDHITPLSQGGQATLDNIVVLCRPCNSRKGNRA
jgi:5-methylcytosine-specific restriction protein A